MRERKISPPNARGWSTVAVEVYEDEKVYFCPVGYIRPVEGGWVARTEGERSLGQFRSQKGAVGALIQAFRRRDPGETRVWRDEQ